MKGWTIFQRGSQPDWRPGRKAGLWCWNLGLYLLAVAGLGFLSLRLATGPYPAEFRLAYWEDPRLILLNVLPVMALGLILYGILGRAQWSFLLTAGVTLGLTAGNYWKLTFRDDPLMIGDLLLLREAGNMASRYHPWFNGDMALLVLPPLGAFALLWLLARGRPRWGLRLGTGLAGLVLLAGLVFVSMHGAVYTATLHEDRLEDYWSGTEQYVVHGFVYPFIWSVRTSVDTAPAGYSPREARETLSRYTDQDIPEDKKVSIIAVQLEAFNDFTRLGAPELAMDVYADWHRIEAEGVSGNLVTNVFGGGTVDTERLFITGYSTLYAFRGAVNAYPWYFRTQGYRVEGCHGYVGWFYDRQNINENLGFPDYLFFDNYYAPMVEEHAKVAMDRFMLTDLIQRFWNATADGTPYFNFSVTYQGHGPYAEDVIYWGDGTPEQYVVNNGRFTKAEHCLLANYFGSICNTSAHVGYMADLLREDRQPVVLVFFGDHNPMLGNGLELYEQMGLNLDRETRDGFLNYFSTRYIIWANDAAKEVLGTKMQGTGPDLSPGFLMNEVFSLCGWEGPAYQQYTSEVAARIPVVHASGRCMAEGVLTDDPPEPEKALLREYQNVQYYYLKHFAYGKE